MAHSSVGGQRVSEGEGAAGHTLRTAKAVSRPPTSIIGIAQNSELLHRLDAAFLRVGEECGGMLVKFHGSEPASVDELRKDFEDHGLNATDLEGEGRLRFSAEKDPLEEREDALRQIVEEERENGREVWVSFDWVESKDLESMLLQQRRLMELASGERLVIKPPFSNGWRTTGRWRFNAGPRRCTRVWCGYQTLA